METDRVTVCLAGCLYGDGLNGGPPCINENIKKTNVKPTIYIKKYDLALVFNGFSLIFP